MNGAAGPSPPSALRRSAPAWGPSSGDFLARIGLQWQRHKAYDALGTVTADFSETKSGGGGGYSYIGIYGWSVNPCIEWYIVDDSYNKLPVNPGSTTNKGTVTIDGGTYNLSTRPTTGTGGTEVRQQRHELEPVLQHPAVGSHLRDNLHHRALQRLGQPRA